MCMFFLISMFSPLLSSSFQAFSFLLWPALLMTFLGFCLRTPMFLAVLALLSGQLSFPNARAERPRPDCRASGAGCQAWNSCSLLGHRGL